jgi:hypothetical protein
VFLGSWWGVILLLLNCRLDVWMATVRGTDLAEAHSVLPMWIVHLGTLLLLLWAGWLMAKPRGGLGDGERETSNIQHPTSN